MYVPVCIRYSKFCSCLLCGESSFGTIYFLPRLPFFLAHFLERGSSQILKSFSPLHSPLQGREEDQEGNYTNRTMVV